MVTTNPKVSDAKVISTQPLDPSESRWTRLTKTTYKDPLGEERTWESAERQTRPKNATIDGVGIVAILPKSTGPEIVLQRQFRPPINKVVIEVPAGLIDEGETAEQCAVRELKEETGYVGRAVEKSPVMFNGAYGKTGIGWMLRLISENQDLKPQLEDNEFIETFSIPIRTLYEECKRLEVEGYAIDARVGTLAEGIELARSWSLYS